MRSNELCNVASKLALKLMDFDPKWNRMNFFTQKMKKSPKTTNKKKGN